MSRPKINQIIYMLRDFQETLTNKLLWSVEALKPIAHSWVPSRFGNLSYFDQFLLLNLALLTIIILQPLLDLFRPARIWKRMTRMFFSLPFVKRQFEKEVSKMKNQIASTFQGDQIPILEEIPFKNMEIKISDTCEVQSLKGQMSGSRYPGKAHSQIVSKISKHDLFVNPIHPHVHPLIRQLEREVVQMATKMLNFRTESNQACGTIFSGGTESIIMATLAYREYKIRHEGVTRPNIVVCSTGHVAALKAASYLNLEFREVSYDKDARMSIPAMKKAIDSQTVMVYLSYPNYPFGTADPVEEVAKICRSKGIPIHLDMCLGGFVVPFLTSKDGKPQLVVPKGVTTISLDPHKYGLSAKGCSLLLFSDQKYKRAQQMPKLANSCLNESPGFSGSRSGLSVASAWISMMKMGVRGYTENAQALRNSAEKINFSLKQMGFRQFGSSTICVFNLIHDRIPASTIQNLMKKRGWGLAANREPVFLRYSLTPLNCSHVDKIISDFKDCLKEAEGLPIQKPSADLELYGACSKIPDGETKLALIEYLLDAFMDIV